GGAHGDTQGAVIGAVSDSDVDPTDHQPRSMPAAGSHTVAGRAGADGTAQARDFRQRPLPTSGSETPLASGHSQQEVDARQVRAHQMEVIQAHFNRWVLIFTLLMCVLLPVMLGLFTWLVYSLVADFDLECDVPLKAWTIVVCSNTAYHLNCGLGSMHTRLLQLCCKYDPTESRPAPWYVRLYNMLMCLLTFAWHCIGLHWVRISDTCGDTSPLLYEAVKAA
ncbi:unnamed protein product, partial [Prorocentrum cordatum]